ncbi:hypothetical protein HYFRA_00007260 [Hymenoscyphus fraxineus]|uniref:Uncharacterized protein n=1 Tax=Hymenoscyphus fraxineus TaxID=746836 RepID=A0A9N9L1A7_9HELO|nr:hypothetical protein HYFRA_00007260 [Hymenoscyphus fraxineus]
MLVEVMVYGNEHVLYPWGAIDHQVLCTVALALSSLRVSWMDDPSLTSVVQTINVLSDHLNLLSSDLGISRKHLELDSSIIGQGLQLGGFFALLYIKNSNTCRRETSSSTSNITKSSHMYRSSCFQPANLVPLRWHHLPRNKLVEATQEDARKYRIVTLSGLAAQPPFLPLGTRSSIRAPQKERVKAKKNC